MKTVTLATLALLFSLVFVNTGNAQDIQNVTAASVTQGTSSSTSSTTTSASPCPGNCAPLPKRSGHIATRTTITRIAPPPPPTQTVIQQTVDQTKVVAAISTGVDTIHGDIGQLNNDMNTDAGNVMWTIANEGKLTRSDMNNDAHALNGSLQQIIAKQQETIDQLKANNKKMPGALERWVDRGINILGTGAQIVTAHRTGVANGYLKTISQKDFTSTNTTINNKTVIVHRGFGSNPNTGGGNTAPLPVCNGFGGANCTPIQGSQGGVPATTVPTTVFGSPGNNTQNPLPAGGGITWADGSPIVVP